MFEFLIAAAVALTANGATIDYKSRDTMAAPINPHSVRHITCPTGAGSAFPIANDIYISAHHVTEDKECKDTETGIKLTPYHLDKVNDIVLMRPEKEIPKATPLKYSCQPFKTDNTYYSVGWASAILLIGSPLIAQPTYEESMTLDRGYVHDKLRVLVGLLVRGMSGGPVVDAKTGVVHGINNVSWLSILRAYSRELKDTAICK